MPQLAILIATLLAGCAAVRPLPTDGRLAAFAWLAGSWVHERDGSLSEEHWTAPRAGSMLGVARTIEGGETVHHEAMRIEVDGAKVVLVATPKGQPTASFTLVASGARRASFANETHDFPQRITYWVTDDGRLHARIEGREGEATAVEWSWRRTGAF